MIFYFINNQLTNSFDVDIILKLVLLFMKVIIYQIFINYYYFSITFDNEHIQELFYFI